MKKKCYPKYSYMLYLLLSILLVIMSILPLFFNTNERALYIILWSGLMIMLALLCLIGFFFNLQYYKLIDNNIIIFNIFGEINKIDLSNAVYEVKDLDSYFSWAISISKKWICIYEKKQFYNKFSYGCSNKKNNGRIQIIFTNELLDELKKRNVSQLNEIVFN